MRRSRASPRPGRRVCRLTACRRYRPGLRLLSSWPPAAGMENGNRSALARLDAGLGARSWSRCWSGAGASRRRGRFAITRLGGRRSWSTDDGTTWLAAAGPPGVDAVARVFQKIERSLQGDLRAHGLNGAQFDVLAQTGSAEGLGQAGTRRPPPRHQRRRLATSRQDGAAWDRPALPDWACPRCLHDGGRRLYQEVVPAHEDAIAEQFAILSPEERAHLLALLRKLDHALRNSPCPRVGHGYGLARRSGQRSARSAAAHRRLST